MYNNIVGLLATQEKKISKLLSLKQISDGAVGELFEVFVYNNLKGYNVEHIGIHKEKADLIIDGERFSCKATGIKATAIKMAGHCRNELRTLKNYTKKEAAEYILNNVEFLKFLFCVDRGGYGYISVASIDHVRDDLINNNFKIIKNDKSIRLLLKSGGSINIDTEHVFFNKKCFKGVAKAEFKLATMSAYDVLAELL